MLQRLRLFSLLDRYIFAELVMPCLFGLGLFTSVGLTIGVLFDVLRKVLAGDITAMIATQVLILRLPEFLVLGLPMAMLLGSLTAYSGMSSFSEIIALRSAGLSQYRLIIPGLFLGLIMAGVTFGLNDWVVPQTTQRASILQDGARGKEIVSYQEKNIIYPEYERLDPNGRPREVLKTLFYAERFDGETMSDLTILDRSHTDANQVISATSANWDDAEQGWQIYNGSVYQIDRNGSYNNIQRFEQKFFELSEAPLVLATQCKNFDALTLRVMDICLESLQLSRNETKIRTLQVKKQEKFSLPFVCVVFALVGTAVGLRPQNSSQATSVGLSVSIVFAYYLVSVISSSMGVWGTVSPLVGTWFPNIAGVAIAGFILWKSP